MALADVAQTVDNTSAWLAFSGALLVALIAATTAQLRLRAQLRHDRDLKTLDLRHESERLMTQLTHDQERQQAQLAHDRVLTDLAELRGVLDQATSMTWDAMNRLTDAWQASDQWAEAEPGEQAEDAGRAAVAHRHGAFEAIWPLEGMLGRLAVRLGDREITQALSEYHQAAKTAARAVPLSQPPNAGFEVWRRDHAPHLRSSRQSFLDEALRLVGSRVTSDT